MGVRAIRVRSIRERRPQVRIPAIVWDHHDCALDLHTDRRDSRALPELHNFCQKFQCKLRVMQFDLDTL